MSNSHQNYFKFLQKFYLSHCCLSTENEKLYRTNFSDDEIAVSWRFHFSVFPIQCISQMFLSNVFLRCIPQMMRLQFLGFFISLLFRCFPSNVFPVWSHAAWVTSAEVSDDKISTWNLLSAESSPSLLRLDRVKIKRLCLLAGYGMGKDPNAKKLCLRYWNGDFPD